MAGLLFYDVCNFYPDDVILLRINAFKLVSVHSFPMALKREINKKLKEMTKLSGNYVSANLGE